MNPPKYHIYIEYEEKEKSGVRFNLTEEELDRTFLTPYKAQKTFMFMGRLMDSQKVQKVIIFWSYQDGGTLILPNREMVAGHPDKKFAMEKICMGKVKGVSVCTERYLSPADKNKEFTSQS